jgi:predicted TIM-barrel fold metal-dependent hydrolase
MIVDAHAHLGPASDALDRWMAVMDRLGIERAFMVAGGSVSPEVLARQINEGGGCDRDIDNARLLDQCAQRPTRLYPFFFANPHRGAGSYRDQGRNFFGLKLGPAVHGVPLRDERHLDLFAQAEYFGHAVYLHCLARPGFEVRDLVWCALRFPKVRFVLGHAGIGNCDFHAVTLIEKVQNVSFETSGGFSSVVQFAMKRLGAARVIFGSEYPLQAPEVELEKARVLELTSSERRRYLSVNALELLPLPEVSRVRA